MPGRVLIHKLGAAGDVVRTTPVLRVLDGYEVHWLVASKNEGLLAGLGVSVYTSVDQIPRGVLYDLVVSLEEDPKQLAALFHAISYTELVGTYLTESGEVDYTDSAQTWFDMSLISRLGKKRADVLKLQNRRPYQSILFQMLGYEFKGEPYCCRVDVPETREKNVLLADNVGPTWPSKRWAHFTELEATLAELNISVTRLPLMSSFAALAAEVARFGTVVCCDSLPMHLALGTGVPKIVSIFTCTSPWEIFDYGRMSRVVSPRLTQDFYIQDERREAMASISVRTVIDHLELPLCSYA